MKIFLDTAHVESIKKWAQTGLIDGVTTNPTHLSKEGGAPEKIIAAICQLLPEGDISVEVTEVEPENVYKQAKSIAQLSENVVVKIPCHLNYYPVIKQLVDDGIRINITLVFTLIQSMMMCKLGVEYISPFVGRLDDIDVSGIEAIAEIRAMIDEYDFSSHVLAASLRHVRHVHEAIAAGAHAITLPVEVLEKCTMHPLTDIGMATFLSDWRKLGIKIFPK